METNRHQQKLAIDGGPMVRTEPWPPRRLLGAEEKAAVDRLFDQAIATGGDIGYNGPEEQAYCREFAEFLGGGYADAVSSGSAAVYVALRALDPEPFTEIIVSVVTDPGGVMPIPMLNCIPVVADTAPGSYNSGPGEIEKLISPLTSAIVIAHIFGEPAEIEAIAAVARSHRLPLLEDCAQAHGARMNGRHVGTFGEIAAFSTMFGKHHCTGPQGGVVFTRDERLYARARQASDRGKPFELPPGSTNSMASLNFNLNDLAAAIGRVQLKRLPVIVGRRRELAAKIAQGMAGLDTVSIPPVPAGAEPTYWFLRLRFHSEKATCSKDVFCRALAAEGLKVMPTYITRMPHRMDWFQKRRVFGQSSLPWSSPQYRGDPDRDFPCPNAMAAMETCFNLTLLESWGDQEVADIVAALRKVDAAYRRRAFQA